MIRRFGPVGLDWCFLIFNKASRRKEVGERPKRSKKSHLPPRRKDFLLVATVLEREEQLPEVINEAVETRDGVRHDAQFVDAHGTTADVSRDARDVIGSHVIATKDVFFQRCRDPAVFEVEYYGEQVDILRNRHDLDRRLFLRRLERG